MERKNMPGEISRHIFKSFRNMMYLRRKGLHKERNIERPDDRLSSDARFVDEICPTEVAAEDSFRSVCNESSEDHVAVDRRTNTPDGFCAFEEAKENIVRESGMEDISTAQVLAKNNESINEILIGCVGEFLAQFIAFEGSFTEDLARIGELAFYQNELCRKALGQNEEFENEISMMRESFDFEQKMLMESHELSAKRFKSESKMNLDRMSSYEAGAIAVISEISAAEEIIDNIITQLDFGRIFNNIALCNDLNTKKLLLRGKAEDVVKDVSEIQETVEKIRLFTREVLGRSIEKDVCDGVEYLELENGKLLAENKKVMEENSLIMSRVGDVETRISDILSLVSILGEQLGKGAEIVAQASERSFRTKHELMSLKGFNDVGKKAGILNEEIEDIHALMGRYKRSLDSILEQSNCEREKLSYDNDRLADMNWRLKEELSHKNLLIKNLEDAIERDRLNLEASLKSARDLESRAMKLEISNNEERTKNMFLEAQLVECDMMIKKLNEKSSHVADSGESSGIKESLVSRNIDAALQIDKLSKKHRKEVSLLHLRIEELEMTNNELVEKLRSK